MNKQGCTERASTYAVNSRHALAFRFHRRFLFPDGLTILGAPGLPGSGVLNQFLNRIHPNHCCMSMMRDASVGEARISARYQFKSPKRYARAANNRQEQPKRARRNMRSPDMARSTRLRSGWRHIAQRGVAPGWRVSGIRSIRSANDDAAVSEFTSCCQQD